jgi:cation/acetate symporter
MTYPKALKAAAQKVVEAAPAKIAKLQEDVAATTQEPAARAKAEKALDSAKKEAAANQATLKKYANDDTSLVGLEKPLFELRNPGIISIPLGFLAVLFGSLLYRDRRAEDMWDELYVRSNTGLGRAATSH